MAEGRVLEVERNEEELSNRELPVPQVWGKFKLLTPRNIFLVFWAKGFSGMSVRFF